MRADNMLMILVVTVISYRLSEISYSNVIIY